MSIKKHGWLIYREEDAKRNERFIKLLFSAAEKRNLSLSLITLEQFSWNITNGPALFQKKTVADPDFLLNRSISHWVNELAEYKNIPVMNSSFISRMANDKRMAHVYFRTKKIPMLETVAATSQSLKNSPFSYPFVIKNPYGRGGGGVHFIKSRQELNEKLSMEKNTEWLVQPIAGQPGKDLRVYIVGNEIKGAVLRESSSSKELRANISTGGTSRLYELSDTEKELVEEMCKDIRIDFAGIDFLFAENGELLFNEMEDAVGCRSLYMNSSIDIADLFMDYIKHTFFT